MIHASDMTTMTAKRLASRPSSAAKPALSSTSAAVQDSDDDVRAVAAEALLPVAAQLASMRAASSAALSTQLWDILLDVDELSPSTGAASMRSSKLCNCSNLPPNDSAKTV